MPMAPTKHNIICDGKSAADVIELIHLFDSVELCDLLVLFSHATVKKLLVS